MGLGADTARAANSSCDKNNMNATSRKWPVAAFGDSDKLRIGDVVYAMGSPSAISQSVTRGIVSNTRMTMPELIPITFRLDGTTLLIKPGTTPEGPLVARSETRFTDPRGPAIEFQLDSAGKVTGLVLEQGPKKTPATRIP